MSYISQGQILFDKHEGLVIKDVIYKYVDKRFINLKKAITFYS